MSLGDMIIKDDTQKVFWVNNHLVGVCGRARAINTFVTWLQKMTDYHIVNQEVGELVDLVPPALEDDEGYSALVVTPSRQVLMYEGNTPIDMGMDVPMSVGSGSCFALAAMKAGNSAEEAVKVACELDVYSGGEITIVQLEDEPEPLTREIAENLSKDELINILFGEEENNEIAEGTVLAPEEEQGDKVVWGDNKVTLYFPDEDSPEYFVSFEVEKNKMYAECDLDELDVTVMEEWFYDIEDLRNYCEYMSIKHKPSNTYKQLAKKIIEEIKSKIPQT
jgi:ATP-dependent protease HslVU (ClpYQ) peptidase subunit